MGCRIVSYYTKDTIYETIMVNYLMASLVYHKLPNFLQSRKDMGSWKENVKLQPEVIWTAMMTFPNDNIIWMDADTVIRYYPYLFNEIPQRCDIGLYYMKHEDHFGGVPVGVEIPKPSLNTGIMYFHNTPKMLAFVEEWMNRTAKTGKDHRKVLEQLVDERVNDDLSFFLLPRAYAYLVEREDGSLPCVTMEDPIIAQFCASAQGKANLYYLKTFDQEEGNAS